MPAKRPTKTSPVTGPAEDVRTGLSVESFKRAFLDNLYYVQARFPVVATRNDIYMALAYTVRDRILAQWAKTAQTYPATTV